LEAYVKLGAIYEKQKRREQAIAVYRASLEINPNQPIMYEALKRVEK
jgi:Flp pilus assembly protein TadD